METPQEIAPDRYKKSRILANLGRISHVSPEVPDLEKIREVIRRKQNDGRPEESSPDEGSTIREAIRSAHDTNPLDVARVVGDTDILEAIRGSQGRNEGEVDRGTIGPKNENIRDAIQRALFGHS